MARNLEEFKEHMKVNTKSHSSKIKFLSMKKNFQEFSIFCDYIICFLKADLTLHNLVCANQSSIANNNIHNVIPQVGSEGEVYVVLRPYPCLVKVERPVFDRPSASLLEILTKKQRVNHMNVLPDTFSY